MRLVNTNKFVKSGLARAFTVGVLASIVIGVPTNALADVDAELNALKQQVKQLERQTKQANDRSVFNRKSLKDAQDRLKTYGFFNFGISRSDSELPYGNTDIRDGYDLQSDTIMGLQMEFKVADNIDFTTQLIKDAGEDVSIETAWAYLSYALTDDTEVRAGRMRLPFYLMSEYLDVGVAYPWVRPPMEAYRYLNIDNSEIVDLLHRRTWGDAIFNFQASFGRGVVDREVFFFELNNMAALSVEMNVGAWQARLGHAAGKFLTKNFDDQYEKINFYLTTFFKRDDYDFDNESVSFSNFSVAYNDGSHWIQMELISRDLPETSADVDAFYASYGYRINKVMPFFTYAKAYSRNNAYRAGTISAVNGVIPLIPIIQPDPEKAEELKEDAQELVDTITASNFTVTSYTVGARYDLTPRVALKAQVVHNRDMDGTVGLFNEVDPTTNQPNDDDVNVYTIAVQSAF